MSIGVAENVPVLALISKRASIGVCLSSVSPKQLIRVHRDGGHVISWSNQIRFSSKL